MKTSTIRFALALAAGAASALTGARLWAHDDKPKQEHGGHAHAEAAKPGSAAAALAEVHRLHAKLGDQVKSKDLKSVHETAEELNGVLASLPALSKDLPGDKLKRVEGAIKNLARALDALHDAADEGNQAQSEKHLGTVDSLVKLLAAQYPSKGDGHQH